MDQSINAYEKKARVFSEVVWFEDNVALLEGQAVCYNWDFYSGADTTHLLSDARRRNRVETPSTTNAQHFAGVCARGYSAKSGGRLIEINKPGSVCNILLGLNQTEVINVGILTFDVTSGFVGEFRYSGLPGAGSAVPCQRVTTTSARATCLAELQVGSPSGGVEVVQLVANTAFVAMVGGTSLLVGYAAATHASEEVADGTIEGLRKKFQIITTAVSGGGTCIIDIVNDDGVDPGDGTQDLDGLNFIAIGAGCVLEWLAGAWNVRGQNGCTLDTT